MRRYWVKIALGALLVFGLGYAAYATGRSFVGQFKSDEGITIPLGPFVPFKLDGEKLGTIRSITFQRDAPDIPGAPRALSGFVLRTRLADSAAFQRVRNCHLSVTDPAHIDERTTFFCLPADSGYEAFGEVRMELRIGNDSRTMIQPLLLPHGVVQDIRRKATEGSSRSLGDSIAAEVRTRVRVQSRAYSDSVRAVRLEEDARRMQQQAESLKARSQKPPPSP